MKREIYAKYIPNSNMIFYTMFEKETYISVLVLLPLFKLSNLKNANCIKINISEN